jgi:aminoglycoside 3-N-acetyltransferase
MQQPLISKMDIIQSLKKTCLQKGDTVFIHSGLGNFGWLKEVRNKIELANLVIDSFFEVIGDVGTIAVPTFTYSFTKGELFDVEDTPSTVGTLTEVFRKRNDARRSIHPIFSVAAIGPNADFLTQNLDKTSFGKDSVFQRLLDLDAKYMFYGVDAESCTFIHLIEKDFDVPYRFDKKFSGEIIANGVKYKDTYTFYVRYLDKNVVTYLTRFQTDLEEIGAMIKVKLGNGHIRVISTKRLYDEGMKMLEKDVYYFLKEEPK